MKFMQKGAHLAVLECAHDVVDIPGTCPKDYSGPTKLHLFQLYTQKINAPWLKISVPREFRQMVAHLGVTGGTHDVGDGP